MRIKKITASLSAAFMIAGGVTLAFAPAVPAATLNYTLNCDGPVTIFGSPGDTINFTLGSGCDEDWYLWNISPEYPSEVGSGFLGYVSGGVDYGTCSDYCGDTPEDWYAYSDGIGTTVITTTLLAMSGNGAALTVGNVVADLGNTVDYPVTYGGVANNAESVNAPIPTWVQSVGRPSSSSSCESGWSPSWQEWAIPVTGGWVCTRSIPSLG